MVKLWKREIELIVGGKRITSPPLDIDFEIRFDTDEEPNDGRISIYNLSRDTMNRIKVGEAIVVNAGYQGDVGTIFAGAVDRKFGMWRATDHITEIEVGDTLVEWSRVRVSKSYQAGIKASAVVRDVLKSLGLEIGALSLPTDVTYSRGRSVNGPVRTVLSELARDCGAKLHIFNGAVFLNDPAAGQRTGFVLRHDTGLVESPERVEGIEGVDYKVISLLNHRIKPDTILKIESRTATGLFRVVSGYHIGSDSDFFTEMEVVAV
jgi:hypothetical protein